MFIRAAATTILLLASIPASAMELGHPAGPMICESDIHNLCEDVYPDVNLVAACLVDKRSKLSMACAQQLAHPEADDDGETE